MSTDGVCASNNQGKRTTFEQHDLVPDSDCHDQHESCEAWAAIKWCSKDPVLMQSLCPVSFYQRPHPYTNHDLQSQALLLAFIASEWHGLFNMLRSGELLHVPGGP